MFETMTQFVFADHLYGHTFIPADGDFGYPRVLNPHRRPYATRDGFVCAVVYTDEQWKRFLGLIGREELFESDPRFATIVARTANVAALYEFLSDTLATRTTEEWRAALRPLDIPVFPMNTFESLLSDPHLAEIGFFEESEHPSEGRIRTMACPSEWSQTPASIRRHAPRLGEHSREVLAEAGYSSTGIDALIAAGITRQA
jgi:crotonobetainyl-CoA:carnitine CoA-transferase CaiB-like acyl-CoA transferase